MLIMVSGSEVTSAVGMSLFSLRYKFTTLYLEFDRTEKGGTD